MIKKTIKQSLIKQSRILFQNAEKTIKSVNEKQLYNKDINKWPIGEQIYHMLHSMDQWFINPYDYSEQELAFSKKNRGKKLSKAELTKYFKYIKSKTFEYLGRLDTKSLVNKPKRCRFNRIELILGQYRHIMYHVGYINACLKSKTGKSPKFIGLSLPVKPKH